jgi:hypothetical protein
MNSWTDDQTEVRYHLLRPAEAVKRREAIMPNKGMLPQDANGDFGYKIIEQVADLAIAETSHRLANPTLYRGIHCLDKGKWKPEYRK